MCHKKIISSITKYKIAIAICIHLLLLQFATSAQENGIVQNLQIKFNEYQQQSIQEKIFVHTDKNFYVAGEIIWFKLYNTDASFHLPIDISKVGYVEVIDRNNKPILQAKIELKNGHGNGSFYIPTSINSGNYKLRAYTNWMKNYSPDFFFEKTITLINSHKATEQNLTPNTAPIRIQFFPEGGNLVNNIQSKVAFKITGEDGKGVEEFTGTITDENNHTLLQFEPLKFGMGSFYFTPQTGHEYKVLLLTADGKRTTANLPKANNEGYVMQLNNETNNQVSISVTTNIASAGNMYLFVHTRQSIKSITAASLQNGQATFTIDKDKLGDGISSFTLFNSDRQPICERLFFKYPQKKLNIQAETNKQIFNLRDKINVHIRSSDEKGTEQAADMSMAVYKVDSLQSLDDNTISSYFWLNSDLKGTIESPGYYFNNPDKTTIEALDNLLLTQGWRRFNWDAVLHKQTPTFSFAPEYNGHILSGKVVQTLTGAIGKDIEGYLSIPGTRTHFTSAHSDSNGVIYFEMREMLGSSEIIVQTNPLTDSLYRIEMNNPFSSSFSNTSIPEYRISKMFSNTLLDQSISMQVQNIFTNDKRNQLLLPELDTAAFYINPTDRYLLDNYTRFTTMEEVLREYVSKIMVRKKKGVFNIPVMDIAGHQYFEANPLTLVDGVPVFDMNKVMEFDPLKIKKLEVVNGRYFSGSSYYDGIMNWTTYKGDLNGIELDQHATVIDYEGLQLQREFYAPSYEDEQQRISHLPDFRSTLYWLPNLTTNAFGKQEVTFYTSDLPGKYVAIVQGNTANGTLGSQQFSFEVK